MQNSAEITYVSEYFWDILHVFSKIRDDSSIPNEAKEFLAFLPSDLDKKWQLWDILSACRGSIPGGSKRFLP